jgi:hypothetical protein
MALARIGDRAQDSPNGPADRDAAEVVPARLQEDQFMKRLIPFLTVLIVAAVLFAFASRTEQGATIRADVRKRVSKIRDDMQDMTSEVEDGVDDVAIDTETVIG